MSASWSVFSVTGPTVVLSEIVVESRPPPSTETPSFVAVSPKSNSTRVSFLPTDSFTNPSASPVAITNALFFAAALSSKPSLLISVLKAKSPISSRVPVESGSANAGPAGAGCAGSIATDIAPDGAPVKRNLSSPEKRITASRPSFASTLTVILTGRAAEPAFSLKAIAPRSESSQPSRPSASSSRSCVSVAVVVAVGLSETLSLVVYARLAMWSASGMPVVVGGGRHGGGFGRRGVSQP